MGKVLNHGKNNSSFQLFNYSFIKLSSLGNRPFSSILNCQKTMLGQGAGAMLGPFLPRGSAMASVGHVIPSRVKNWFFTLQIQHFW